MTSCLTQRKSPSLAHRSSWYFSGLISHPGAWCGFEQTGFCIVPCGACKWRPPELYSAQLVQLYSLTLPAPLSFRSSLLFFRHTRHVSCQTSFYCLPFGLECSSPRWPYGLFMYLLQVFPPKSLCLKLYHSPLLHPYVPYFPFFALVFLLALITV